MYEIILSGKAERQLKKLEKQVQKRICSILERIRIRPEMHLQKLAGEQAYKIRAGDYRIIVEPNHEKQLITVLLIGHRRNIYNQI